jgi:hypothetical protein
MHDRVLVGPELTALQLRAGRYERVARVAGDEPFLTDVPFPVTVVPSELVRAGS